MDSSRAPDSYEPPNTKLGPLKEQLGLLAVERFSSPSCSGLLSTSAVPSSVACRVNVDGAWFYMLGILTAEYFPTVARGRFRGGTVVPI